MICYNCLTQNEDITYKVNGRCDVCGSSDWVDWGNWPAPHYQLFFLSPRGNKVYYYSPITRLVESLGNARHLQECVYRGQEMESIKKLWGRYDGL